LQHALPRDDGAQGGGAAEPQALTHPQRRDQGRAIPPARHVDTAARANPGRRFRVLRAVACPVVGRAVPPPDVGATSRWFLRPSPRLATMTCALRERGPLLPKAPGRSSEEPTPVPSVEWQLADRAGASPYLDPPHRSRPGPKWTSRAS